MEASFGEGFEEYAVGDMARLTRLASMLTRDRDSTHDLVQETLVRVGCAWSRIDRDGSPSGYATTTMSRLAWRQSARSRTEWTLLNRHAPTQTTPDDFSRIDDASALRTAMRRHRSPPRHGHTAGRPEATPAEYDDRCHRRCRPHSRRGDHRCGHRSAALDAYEQE